MRLLPLVAATALVVTLAGCGSGGDSAAPTTSTVPSDAPAVVYMDKVCTAISSYTAAPKTPPPLEGSDPAKRKADMAVYMGQMADAFTQTATKLREVGPSPVPGGDEQVEKMAATFTDIAKNFSDSKAAIEAADANDPVGGLQAAGEAIKRLDEFIEPLKALETSPELTAAAESAPACQGMKTPQPSESAVPTS
ncbi:hypothetical protein ALI22I_37360 [Saccharothrix sp. ALI-22-I]|uniref:hypothetical protein n=1 Tax=Saccharothrix sp. ALI-22-I TaxID=1933778 RepID=UPI00097BB449|nr:hypothetical protein [Saccharothrix sp. ALI-22-I]ONI81868.1 hypothetical protein ALI22I_37360 [Saccharothrix sp. ALI-22-I]